ARSTSRVFAPLRADATAAPKPAQPPPATRTSVSITGSEAARSECIIVDPQLLERTNWYAPKCSGRTRIRQARITKRPARCRRGRPLAELSPLAEALEAYEPHGKPPSRTSGNETRPHEPAR